MFDKIKTLLAVSPDADGPGRRGPVDMKVAAAALMVEAARMDSHFDEAERATIARLLQRRFGLSPEETQTLIEEARQAQDASNQLLGFTRAIKDHFDEAERIELIEMLWEVVYADGILDDFEANLLRRIGGLLYVSDRDRGLARKRVLKKLGLDVN